MGHLMSSTAGNINFGSELNSIPLREAATLRGGVHTGWLGSLALMNCHYDHNVNYKKVADLFFKLNPRWLERSNLIFDIWTLLWYQFLQLYCFFMTRIDYLFILKFLFNIKAVVCDLIHLMVFWETSHFERLTGPLCHTF